jgi:hypothetical protein
LSEIAGEEQGVSHDAAALTDGWGATLLNSSVAKRPMFLSKTSCFSLANLSARAASVGSDPNRNPKKRFSMDQKPLDDLAICTN